MKVKFLPQGVEYEIENNETILHLAQRKGIHIQSVCKGIPSCVECRVQIKEGEHHVPPPSKKEIDLIGTAYYIDMSRLSCQLRCFGDVVVDLSEQMEKEKKAQSHQSQRQRSDGEPSQAVLGGIFDQVSDEEWTSMDEQDSSQSFASSKPLDKKNHFYGYFYKKNSSKKVQRLGKENRVRKVKRDGKKAGGGKEDGGLIAKDVSPGKEKSPSSKRRKKLH